MGYLYSNILETIGNTPVVKINNRGPQNVNIYAKIESFNPMASVKDRLALGVIEDAERRGVLNAAAYSSPGRPWSRQPAATPV